MGRDIRQEIISSGMDIPSSPFPVLFQTACKISLGGYCRTVLPLMLLDDYFESSTIEQCEKMWNVLITMQEDIKALISKASTTGYALLNIVNSLLRRTSKVKNGPFRGSIMV